MNKDKFWGFCENENYKVGCTGGSVHIFDQTGREITRFKGLRYAYTAKFKPGTNIVVVKTTEGMLLIYDLDKLELIKKIVISRDGCQDGGFCFSPDGKWFYNIERPGKSSCVQLSKYDTKDFTIDKVINEKNQYIHLDTIEFSDKYERWYLLGYTRDTDYCYDYAFIAELINDEIKIIKAIDSDTHLYVVAYKDWEDSGFSKKVYEVWRMEEKKIIPVSLEDIVENNWTL